MDQEGGKLKSRQMSVRCEALRTPKDRPATLGGTASGRTGATAPHSHPSTSCQSLRENGAGLEGLFRLTDVYRRVQIRCVQHTCWEKTQPIKRQLKGNLSAGLRSPCKGRVMNKPAVPKHQLGFSQTYLTSLSMPGSKAGTANPPVRRTRQALAVFVLILVRRKIC